MTSKQQVALNQRKRQAKLEYLVMCDQVRRNKAGLIARLSRHLTTVDNPKLGTPCKIWTAGVQNNGYPRMNFRYGTGSGARRTKAERANIVQLRVHRIFLVLMLGRPIRYDAEAGHLCHTPNCVSHVDETTRTDNLRERDERRKENKDICPF